jgi:oligopeptide/dipeptide ABC transporter ATP-binding protein
MSSISVMHTIGNQISEMLLLHTDMSKKEARNRSIELLRLVEIPKPERLIDEYPFRLSGGMRQRVMIAMAISCNPTLLIADEPTTALDVTTQARILELLRNLQEETNMALLFITHDLGVVAEIADDVAVMYLGRVVEKSDVNSIFHNPKHPYTKALLESIPRIAAERTVLNPIEGMIPSPFRRPSGCTFHPRCRERMEQCRHIVPSETQIGENHMATCLLHESEALSAGKVV